MGYPEISSQNKILYEAMENLLRLIVLYEQVKKNTTILKEDLADIKRQINANLKGMAL